MTELRVPEVVEDPFREHYRALILGSVLQSAEAQSERHRARGRRLRARRAETVIARLRPARPERRDPPPPSPPPEQPPPASVAAPAPVPALVAVDLDPWFGPGARKTAFAVWLLTVVALVADVIVLGVGSDATIAADLGLVAMTFFLFFVCIDDLTAPTA